MPIATQAELHKNSVQCESASSPAGERRDPQAVGQGQRARFARNASCAPALAAGAGRETERERECPVDVSERRVHDRSRDRETRREHERSSESRDASGSPSAVMNNGASRKPPLLPSRPETNPTTPTITSTAYGRAIDVGAAIEYRVSRMRIPNASTTTSVAMMSGPPGIQRVKGAPTIVAGRPIGKPSRRMRRSTLPARVVPRPASNVDGMVAGSGDAIAKIAGTPIA